MNEVPVMATPEQALAHAVCLLEREPALAAQQLDELLTVFPGHPTVLQWLARARAAQGDGSGAVAILAPLVQQYGESAALQWDLGRALLQVGRVREAIPPLRCAVAMQPALPQAWRVLGDALALAGDTAGSASAYLEHVHHGARDPRLMAAGVALADNRVPEAEAMLRECLKQVPTDVAALRMLAEVAARLDRSEDALPLLERCLALAPGFREARLQHALVLHRSNRPQESLAQIERLLADDPGNAACRNLQAAVLCRTGDYAQAIDLYAELVKDHADNPKLWVSYGHALKTAGRADEAIVAYRSSLALQPSFGEVWWSLANLKTFHFGVEDLAAMRAQLARADLDEDDRLHLEFAVGKAQEDARNYADSFLHYARANARRRRQVAYDAADTRARMEYVCRHYTRAFFAARAGMGCQAADPIFVLGLPRSGSTLIEQILASHSQVEGTMELPEVASITRELRQQGNPDGAMPYHQALAALEADGLRALGERYLARTRIQRKTAAPFFIDKMPNNFAHIGLIALMLPNAKIIDARRHPMACGFSLFKQHFARGQGFSYDLGDIGRYYCDYRDLMAHFDAVLPGRIHRVHYERMVADTEGEVRRLLDYCGLPFEPACLRFFENERPVRTASSEQVRQPIYREGMDHWRHYEPWLAPLAEALGTALAAYPAASAME